MRGEDTWLGPADQATLTFNFHSQATELKAINRRNGQPAIRVWYGPVFDPSMMLRENWSLMEDINVSLVGWGWKPLTRADWHGVNDWAAQLTPAD